MPMPPIVLDDLDEVLESTATLWEEMRGERVFVSGGTGFFGCWLVESFLHANRKLGLGAEMTVLTRDGETFLRKVPHLRGEAALRLMEGDVADFEFPHAEYGFAIHAATEASARQLAEEPHRMLGTILGGTERMLSFAARAGTRKLLLTSSGAVYGPQPWTLTHVGEEYGGAPDPLLPGSVYGEGKRAAELMCSLAAGRGVEVKIARCFAFLGPHLPLDTHFAAGNFLRDALAGKAIEIASDGTTVRSYLYAGELMIWLWTMLFRAPSMRAYNVGSKAAVSVRELAETVVKVVNPAVEVRVLGQPGAKANRYVPSTARAQMELGLRERVSLEEGLRRTAAWHRLK